MIAIDHVLLSDEIVEEEFVCDLSACAGGCCVEGDCGAPLTEDEADTIARIYPTIKPYLKQEYIDQVALTGTHVYDDEYGAVTPTMGSGICTYAYHDEAGIVKCAIEKAWNAGEVDFRKPISCHLFPIRITTKPGYELVNYEPRKKLCKAACKLGKKLKVPVYRFLKDSITRKYGAEFYETLDAVAKKMKGQLR